MRKQTNLIFGAIWTDLLTPTMSVFLWRLLLDRIPVDAKLISRGISIVSRCHCCSSSHSHSSETIPHLFFDNSIVRAVWVHFTSWFNITLPLTHDIFLFLSFWRNLGSHSHTEHVAFIIPCLILWFTWTERNSAKHRNCSFLAAHIIAQVERHLLLLVSSRKLTRQAWTGCSPTVHFMPQYITPVRVPRSMMVVWLAPAAPWVKLNTDGSFDRDTQIAGGGGLIRDHHGELLLAFHSSFRASSSFDAELQALLTGLQLVTQFSSQVWIELDAAAVVTLLTTGKLGSWQVQHPLLRIRRHLRQLHFRITHIHREGNRPADHLAMLGSVAQGLHTYDAHTASHYLLALVRMDQLGYPSFRHS